RGPAPGSQAQPAGRPAGVPARANHDARPGLDQIARRREIRARARLEDETRMEPAQAREPQPVPALDDPELEHLAERPEPQPSSPCRITRPPCRLRSPSARFAPRCAALAAAAS